MTSKGSKPRSSSCCLLDEPKPKAACQSVEEDTGIVSDVKRLCGSGVIGQSELPRGELGKGGSPAGRGFGCLKLLLSEKSDWDSAAAPSKGDRAVRSETLMGTTKLDFVKPGGEGESLVGICGKVSPFTKLMDSGGLSLGLLLSQLEEKGDRAVCWPGPSSVSNPSAVRPSWSR